MLWTDGPVCPHCGVVDRAYRLEGVRTKPSAKNPEGKERHGLWKCRECRKQFTVRKGTIFEESHLPLHLWLQAIHLMMSSKKGISSHQLHRVLGITYKSAWFLTHRIRECMRDGALAPFGSNGSAVEVDESFIGKEPDVTKKPNARGGADVPVLPEAIVALCRADPSDLAYHLVRRPGPAPANLAVFVRWLRRMAGEG